MLLEIADYFIDSVVHFACALAKHRDSAKLEAKDLKLHLSNSWNIQVAGFHHSLVSAIRTKNPSSFNSHKARQAAAKKIRLS
jgi:transcription initiation factor TFIID subunit 12